MSPRLYAMSPRPIDERCERSRPFGVGPDQDRDRLIELQAPARRLVDDFGGRRRSVPISQSGGSFRRFVAGCRATILPHRRVARRQEVEDPQRRQGKQRFEFFQHAHLPEIIFAATEQNIAGHFVPAIIDVVAVFEDENRSIAGTKHLLCFVEDQTEPQASLKAEVERGHVDRFGNALSGQAFMKVRSADEEQLWSVDLRGGRDLAVDERAESSGGLPSTCRSSRPTARHWRASRPRTPPRRLREIVCSGLAIGPASSCVLFLSSTGCLRTGSRETLFRPLH